MTWGSGPLASWRPETSFLALFVSDKVIGRVDRQARRILCFERGGSEFSGEDSRGAGGAGRSGGGSEKAPLITCFLADVKFHGQVHLHGARGSWFSPLAGSELTGAGCHGIGLLSATCSQGGPEDKTI